MTRTAALPAVIDAAPALIRNGRMRTLKQRRNPRIGIMTGRAILPAEQPGMKNRIAVTAGTDSGKPLELPILMAGFAGNRTMRPRQREIRAIVIKSGRFPGRCAMTGYTILPEPPQMRIVLLVAGKTIRWRILKNASLMAIGAVCPFMRTSQLERKLIMIHAHIIPTGRIMADSAIRAKFAIMPVILFMAGKAISGRALKLAVGMAFFTGHFGMVTFKLKTGQSMVKLNTVLPALGIMALAAIQAKAPSVRIFFLMTGRTRHSRFLQIDNCPRVEMTPGTHRLAVFSR